LVQTVKKHEPFLVNAKDDTILKAVYFYRGLTAEQVAWLVFKLSSISYARERLAKLAAYTYLHRYHYPVLSGFSPWVYELGTLGIKYLRLQEECDISRFRRVEDEERGHGNVKHLLALNDLLIAGEKLSRPSIVLARRVHDWMFRQEPLKVPVGKEEIAVIPDGLLEFRIRTQSTYSYPLWIELDRGSEWGKNIKDKLTALITVVNEVGYKDLFGTEYITVAFVTLGDAKRRDLLRSYVRERLTAMNLLDLSDMFLFATLSYESDPKTKAKWLDPYKTFLSPIWVTAGSSPLPVSLLELP